mmetsp:Transcript_10576/g.18575  ORF Transcript_10576/g.18575 Transcript_10576/m.18575 type:complete len:134 (-) Transcript_10576:128-529(-)|eukprot:CAMPEP_0183702352 /NCGR_PEP_ID=MMETSP0737-20130205/479_1 /TAXON_ID=385413 /ORGANISM="Thalassiosira miniscula, Strain CCMP1093" /LENGTH=133 /DNA_ID=CAMNT_0025928949 /DNA_START=162 /DNA_END=563 /DNA_ORIENTATION=+
MAAKDNYSFEPVGAVDPSTPVVEAIPSTSTPNSYYNEDERPSDTAIMVGCGLLGWVVAGPFLAIVTALGGKYAADRYEGPLAESSKAVGRIAATAGKKAKEENVLGKFKDTIGSLFRKKDCPHCNTKKGTASK